MKQSAKAWVVAGLHVAMIASLGAKMLYDRGTRPRVWAHVAPYDPDLPIRGRYVSLQIEVEAPQIRVPAKGDSEFSFMRWNLIPVALSKENDRLIARRLEHSDQHIVFREVRPGHTAPMLYQRLAYFIPEHAADPSLRPADEELWVEVTLPKNGPPRPIRLAVKKKDGTFTPLPLN